MVRSKWTKWTGPSHRPLLLFSSRVKCSSNGRNSFWNRDQLIMVRSKWTKWTGPSHRLLLLFLSRVKCSSNRPTSFSYRDQLIMTIVRPPADHNRGRSATRRPASVGVAQRPNCHATRGFATCIADIVLTSSMYSHSHGTRMHSHEQRDSKVYERIHLRVRSRTRTH